MQAAIGGVHCYGVRIVRIMFAGYARGKWEILDSFLLTRESLKETQWVSFFCFYWENVTLFFGKAGKIRHSQSLRMPAFFSRFFARGECLFRSTLISLLAMAGLLISRISGRGKRSEQRVEQDLATCPGHKTRGESGICRAVFERACAVVLYDNTGFVVPQ